MAEHIKTSAIKRAGPSIVGIDIDGDREAWKIHIVRAARVNDVSERFVCVVHDKLSDLYYELLQPVPPLPPKKCISINICNFLTILSQNQSQKWRVRDLYRWDYRNSRNSVGILIP